MPGLDPYSRNPGESTRLNSLHFAAILLLDQLASHLRVDWKEQSGELHQGVVDLLELVSDFRSRQPVQRLL